MKMQQKQFRIGQLAKALNVERFVIRFWEKEFQLRGQRSHGGQRFYDGQDLEQFKLIKELLYAKGFTIAGAKKVLQKKQQQEPNNIIASHTTTIEQEASSESLSPTTTDQLIILQKQLIKLRDML